MRCSLCVVRCGCRCCRRVVCYVSVCCSVSLCVVVCCLSFCCVLFGGVWCALLFVFGVRYSCSLIVVCCVLYVGVCALLFVVVVLFGMCCVC